MALTETLSGSATGNTMDESPPVKVDCAQSPVDIYGESKVAAERAIMESGIPYTILRITAIAIPALLDPPDPYPFGQGCREF